MKIIVGLGNPGPRYRHTRHNIGFEVVDTLARQLRMSFLREKYGALVAEGQCQGQAVLLLKPLTMMNNSGKSVARVVRYRAPNLAELLVVVDDAYLPLGKIRIRQGGSAGGHKGLGSVIGYLKTDAFPRLRLGVGGTVGGADLVGHVLGRFSPEERPRVEAMVARAADAATCFVTDGVSAAMNEFN